MRRHAGNLGWLFLGVAVMSLIVRIWYYAGVGR